MSFSLFANLLQAEPSSGSDWNWLVWFILFVIVVAAAMMFQARFGRKETEEFGREAHHEAEARPPVRAEGATPAPKADVQTMAAPAPEAEPQPEPPAAPAPEVPAQPDDLKKIEGIGPKVASLLQGEGITTFAQLAETPLEKLNQILDSNKLQMTEPATWPQQAKLAAAGDWEALQKLQNELKGGR